MGPDTRQGAGGARLLDGVVGFGARPAFFSSYSPPSTDGGVITQRTKRTRPTKRQVHARRYTSTRVCLPCPPRRTHSSIGVCTTGTRMLAAGATATAHLRAEHTRWRCAASAHDPCACLLAGSSGYPWPSVLARKQQLGVLSISWRPTILLVLLDTPAIPCALPRACSVIPPCRQA